MIKLNIERIIVTIVSNVLFCLRYAFIHPSAIVNYSINDVYALHFYETNIRRSCHCVLPVTNFRICVINAAVLL